ncbi:hypothetical protein GLOIN_2v1785889 [Rhizophagus irregularis DAOM 181602=DAOM 197198]|nr:hypothetical protein GLOIN_2v1785889 [Rhizophagus irregularis DAOM 181602=DAOM 197198]
MYTPHAVSVIPELVGHILELIPSSNFGPHLLEGSRKKEKANDALGRSEEEDNRNRDLRELEWKAYQKACKELTDTRKELTIVKGALERFGFQIYVV